MVRGNAALSLVRFGDATGRPQIVALLQPAHHRRPGQWPRCSTPTAPAPPIHQGGLLAKLRRRCTASPRSQ